jgi:sugar lactone lactonase YvrE
VWVSTVFGVFRLDRASGTFTEVYPHYLPDLILGADGALWAKEVYPQAADGSLLRIDPVTFSVQRVRQFPNELIRTLAAGHDGMLWLVLATNDFDHHRLVRVDMAGEIVSSVAAPQAIYSENSRGHVVAAQGLWWSEGVHGGLKLLTPAGEVQSFPLPFGNAFWLASAGDFLWSVSADGAVAKISLTGAVLVQYTTPGRIHGATTDADGDLWLREPSRLTEITRAGVYTIHETIPPHACPEDAGLSHLAFSASGELAITDAQRPTSSASYRPASASRARSTGC